MMLHAKEGKKQILDVFAKGEGEKEVWIETHFLD